MPEHNLDSLCPLMERYPLFADLLPRAAQLAANKGHIYLDTYHCFLALVRDYATRSPIVAAALGNRSYSDFDQTAWAMIKTEPPIEAVSDVTPLLSEMMCTILADASVLGCGEDLMLPLVMFFVARPGNAMYSVYGRLKLDREEICVNIARATAFDSTDWIIEYYIGLNKLLTAVWHARSGGRYP